MRHIRTIIVLVLISSAAATPTTAQTNTDTVFEMPGVFRISLPPCWQRSRVVDDRKTVAAFSSKDLTLEVMRELVNTPVKEYRQTIPSRPLAAAWDEYPGKYSPPEVLANPGGYEATVAEISNESTLIGGLPAQWVRYRLEFKSPRETVRGARVWTVFIPSPGDYWSLQLRGNDRYWPTSDSDLKRMIHSFQFLEPMQARIKAAIPPEAQKSVPPTLREGECSFGGAAFGMSVVLSCDWKVVNQWHGAATKDGLVGQETFVRPALRQHLVLRHYVGNWSADEFTQKQQHELAVATSSQLHWGVTPRYSPLTDGKHSIMVDGVPGTLIYGEASFFSGNKHRSMSGSGERDLLTISRGTDHLSISFAAADFERVLEDLAASMQFPALHAAQPALSSADDTMAGIAQAILDRSGGDVSTLFTEPAPAPTGHEAKLSRETPGLPGGPEMERNREDVRLLKDSGSHYRLGKALDASGDQAAAFAEFEAAVQLNPRNAEADREVARIYAARNDLPNAIAAYERVLLYSGNDDTDAHAQLAALYAKSGNTLFAVFHLIVAGEAASDFTLPADEIAPAQKVLADSGEQLDAATKRFEEDPAPQHRISNRLFRADLVMKYGHFAYADNECRLVHQLDPRNVQALACLVKTANARGEQDAMVGYAREWLALSPNNPEVYFWLARGYSWAPADYVKAAENYEAILRYTGPVQFAPSVLREARVTLPQYYANAQMWQKAAAAYEIAVRELPKDAEALNAAAWFFATTEAQFRNPAKALEYANRALAAAPGDANIMDTLAEAYFVNGRINDAVATEQKALALAPDRADLQKQMERFKNAKKTESPHRK